MSQDSNLEQKLDKILACLVRVTELLEAKDNNTTTRPLETTIIISAAQEEDCGFCVFEVAFSDRPSVTGELVHPNGPGLGALRGLSQALDLLTMSVHDIDTFSVVIDEPTAYNLLTADQIGDDSSIREFLDMLRTKMSEIGQWSLDDGSKNKYHLPSIRKRLQKFIKLITTSSEG
jgi:hypothetical protein